MTNMHKWSRIKKGSAKTGLFCSVISPKYIQSKFSKWLSPRAARAGLIVFAVIIILLITLFVPALYQHDGSEIAVSTPAISISSDDLVLRENQDNLQSQTVLVPPTRIEIPTIHLDATIEAVGVTANGEMGLPNDPNNVAWYDLGQTPGETGTAVIAGHNIWKNGKSSTFANLSALDLGDKIYIENEKGEKSAFIVQKTRKYSPEIDTTDIFRSTDGKAHLNLITCAGSWDKSAQSFTQRLIVFAVKE
jgi:LPXTG-site transpeptidase (sortase) family protein